MREVRLKPDTTTVLYVVSAFRRTHCLREPEVQHLHSAITPHLDVRGLQIAVDDPLLVRGFERLGNLLRDRQCLVERDRAACDPLRQVVALDQLHDEGVNVTRLFESVNDGDVGMVQRRQGPGFTLEAREPLGVVRERLGQDLDRDIAVQRRITRLIHLAHAALADLCGDFVDAETRAGGEGQCQLDYMGESRSA